MAAQYMMFGSPPTHYTRVAMLLHWLIALAVLALIGLGWYMVEIPRNTPPRAYFYNLHKSIGTVTALLIFARIWWRLKHTPPPLPGSMPRWQINAALTSHWLMYACLAIMPLAGFTASNFTKFGVKLFGFQLPILGWEDKAIYEVFNGIHVYTSYLFVALIALHVAAALKHWWIDKDGVFQRMLPHQR